MSWCQVHSGTLIWDCSLFVGSYDSQGLRWKYSNPPPHGVDQILELEFLRPTVSRIIRLGIGPPFGILDQILSCSSFVWQFRCSAFNASSLTRKRLCNLLLNCFWVLPEQSHVSRSLTELTTIFYCLIWDSLNLESQVPVFISPRNRVAQIYPRALGSLSVASYDSWGLRWRYSKPPPHGVDQILELELEFFLLPTVSRPVNLGIFIVLSFI
jgi:hypothetical protein